MLLGKSTVVRLDFSRAKPKELDTLDEGKRFPLELVIGDLCTVGGAWAVRRATGLSPPPTVSPASLGLSELVTAPLVSPWSELGVSAPMAETHTGGRAATGVC